MARILSIYPNCSKGGMATVYRTRALADPDTEYFFLFKNDAGGREAFQGISNIDYKVYPGTRFEAAAKFITSKTEFDEIRLTSLPELASEISQNNPNQVVYEFHTSTMGIIENEMKRLTVDSLKWIQTPSRWLTQAITRRLDQDGAVKCITVPNLVDRNTFNKDVESARLDLGENAVPLLWIGRFDKGKNFNDFLRVAALLPASFVPVAVLSLESQPERISRALLEARAYGLADRLRVFLNLSQRQLAAIYTWARDQGGVLVSTSLSESFGYSIAEALACGLPAAAYRVGGVPEVADCGTAEELVAVGDTQGLAASVLKLAGAPVAAV